MNERTKALPSRKKQESLNLSRQELIQSVISLMNELMLLSIKTIDNEYEEGFSMES